VAITATAGLLVGSGSSPGRPTPPPPSSAP